MKKVIPIEVTIENPSGAYGHRWNINLEFDGVTYVLDTFYNEPSPEEVFQVIQRMIEAAEDNCCY